VLLILDQVQSGLRRTGAWFAFQHEGIQPDGLILGKALGGGVLPVSAFVARRELMDVFTPGSHGSTFGGNPLAAAVGLEALHVLRDEGLVEKSRVLGNHMLRRLRAIDVPALKAVRGRGLWVGAEIDPKIERPRSVRAPAGQGVLSKETHQTVVRLARRLSSRRKSSTGRSIASPRCCTSSTAAPRSNGLNSRGNRGGTMITQDSGARSDVRPEHFAVSYAIIRGWTHRAGPETALRAAAARMGRSASQAPASSAP
jgi:hypothetical protein